MADSERLNRIKSKILASATPYDLGLNSDEAKERMNTFLWSMDESVERPEFITIHRPNPFSTETV